jgi:Prophage minor tail protein Z (GPZ)
MPELFSVEANMASLVDMVAVLRRAGEKAPAAIQRAINHTGDKALTAVTRTLAKQTGVKYRAVRRALTAKRAWPGKATYTISSRGGYLSLKEFEPRQTRSGVSVNVWGKRRVFPRAFIVPRLGGHVFVRVGTARTPLHKMWGPALPAELVKAETADIFLSTVSSELPIRIAHELDRLLQGTK